MNVPGENTPFEAWDAIKDQIIEETGGTLDPEIEEAVVALNALGLKTLQSCAGHVETEGRNIDVPYRTLIRQERKVIGGPWIKILFDDDPEKEFSDDFELELDFEASSFAVESKMLSLMDKFYQDRAVPADVRLFFEGAGDYTLANQGSHTLEHVRMIDRATRMDKLHAYRSEMNDFAHFLRQEYISEYPEVD